MFTVSATGEKLKPLLIHKYQNPRPLYGIDKDTLAVHYYWNSTTWMQTSIFNHWLCKLNETMRKSRRNILLLVDNASSHKINDDTTLSNITVHLLPPNCTAHLSRVTPALFIVSKANIENFIVLIEFKSMIMLLLKTSLFRLFLKLTFVKLSNCWNRMEPSNHRDHNTWLAKNGCST